MGKSAYIYWCSPELKKEGWFLNSWPWYMNVATFQEFTVLYTDMPRQHLIQFITCIADGKHVNWNLRVASAHGFKAPLSFIKSVEISFVDNNEYKPAILQDEPFQLKRRTAPSKTIEMVLKFNLIDGCGCRFTQINLSLNWEVSVDHLMIDKDATIQKLRDSVTDELCCGKNAVIENILKSPKSEVLIYAVVTNVVMYKKTAADAMQAGTPCNGVKRQEKNGNGSASSKKRKKVQI